MSSREDPHRVTSWYGLTGEIEVGNELWRLVRVGTLNLPHPPVVNTFLRAGLPRSDRLRLSFLHEFGHLQTLPVAYDVGTKQWFDTAASGVRHLGSGPPDEPVHWKEWPYTFNTACFNCHVSQFSSNYDLSTDTYRTTWAEAGINCETCHGPSKEHNEVMEAAPKGQVPPDLKIISVK